MRPARDGADTVLDDIVEHPYGDGVPVWGGVTAVARDKEALGGRTRITLADGGDARVVGPMLAKPSDAFGRADAPLSNASARPGADRVLVVDPHEDARPHRSPTVRVAG
ncbi:hypothetical protein HN371_16035 [Candidatus Poribacteria bacterium]|nr:hypothetical protein [Candidatus Poribacteria bacterium]MBT5712938.1 hypothetical protein [Candidatus Poribacteria bacterium]MBT7100061.1 hypothetical protein [Candidatus Poribacteria bacterium]MBT7805083.1 hypothetical protein [Candidatus Poribacteria bacterium]